MVYFLQRFSTSTPLSHMRIDALISGSIVMLFIHGLISEAESDIGGSILLNITMLISITSKSFCFVVVKSDVLLLWSTATNLFLTSIITFLNPKNDFRA